MLQYVSVRYVERLLPKSDYYEVDPTPGREHSSLHSAISIPKQQQVNSRITSISVSTILAN